jgi:hypothetical protein
MSSQDQPCLEQADAFQSWVDQFCLATWAEAPQAWDSLAVDGSNRKFFRVRTSGRSLLALCHPEGTPDGTGENDAYWSIGRHLHSRGIPVPAFQAYERKQGWIILQDLGDVTLQEAVRSAPSQDELLPLYEPVLDSLLALQLRGREGFLDAWCHQTSRYDERVMLERESGYFLNAFLKGYLVSVPQFPLSSGGEGKGEGSMGPEDEQTLLQEFRALAHLASKAPIQFLMHRDFQSRNILFPSPALPHLIDFQGARWGPLQYDVAALTIDPYVDLAPETREAILHSYAERLGATGVMRADDFMEQYPIIALHRNLQILGAFAFLGRVKQKPFFLQWIPGALWHLRALLRAHPEWPCPHLRDEAERASLLLGQP